MQVKWECVILFICHGHARLQYNSLHILKGAAIISLFASLVNIINFRLPILSTARGRLEVTT